MKNHSEYYSIDVNKTKKIHKSSLSIKLTQQSIFSNFEAFFDL